MHRNRGRGFTLLELLVVLVLISLGAAFVLPRVGASMPGLQMRTAARKVAATFRYAVQRAMTEQVVYTVRFNDADGTVRLAADSATAPIPPDPGFEPAKPPTALEQWQLPEGLRLLFPLDREAQTIDDHYVVFFYPGGAGSGGAVRLAGPGDRQMEIQADFITSEITIRDVKSND